MHKSGGIFTTPNKKMNTPTNTQLPQEPLTALFRRNMRGIGLTYSNVAQQLGKEDWDEDCPTKIDVGHALLELQGEIDYMQVAEELHKDGSVHYHVLIQWLTPHSPVAANFFDVLGLHPNIQQLKDINAWQKYINKEDSFPFVFVNIE